MRIGIDVGGTNTDAVLMDGRRVLGAVKTPATTDVDVYSFGLGGGSIVVGADLASAPSAPITIGPQSVGYELTTQALVFGGDTLTTTDVAVAAGLAIVGPRYFGYDIDYRPVESRFG